MTQRLGGNSGSREPDPSFTGSGPAGFDPGRERAFVVAFLRAEADAARHAQGNAAVDHPDKLYRMGQKDGLLLAAEAIERGHHLIGEIA